MWHGAVDGSGRPHGRGTLSMGKRARYEGHMRHGLSDGLGTLYVDEDASDEEGACCDDDGEMASVPTRASAASSTGPPSATCARHHEP